MILFPKGLFVIVLGTGSLKMNSPEAFHMCLSIIQCLEGLVLNGKKSYSLHIPAPLLQASNYLSFITKFIMHLCVWGKSCLYQFIWMRANEFLKLTWHHTINNWQTVYKLWCIGFHSCTSIPTPCCLPTVQILRNQGSVHWTRMAVQDSFPFLLSSALVCFHKKHYKQCYGYNQRLLPQKNKIKSKNPAFISFIAIFSL